jgi:hypothetical protein
MRTLERSRDRLDLVQEAGLRTTSVLSVVSGTMVAFGTLALLLGVAAAVGDALGVDTDGLSTNDWQDVGLGMAIAFAVVSFAAYFFGGYVAGRMARRAGFRHGVLTVVLGLLLTLGVTGLANLMGDREAAVDDLRDQGVPTEADDWEGVGLVAGIAALAAMVVGGVLGGKRGEGWHGRLVTRAADPTVVSRSEARAVAGEERERTRRVERRQHLDLGEADGTPRDRERIAEDRPAENRPEAEDRPVADERHDRPVTVPDGNARPVREQPADTGWRRLFRR